MQPIEHTKRRLQIASSWQHLREVPVWWPHQDHRKNAKGLLHQVEPRWWGSLHCSWHPGFAGFPGFATRISVEVSSSDDPLPHVGAFSEPLAPLAALAALR